MMQGAVTINLNLWRGVKVKYKGNVILTVVFLALALIAIILLDDIKYLKIFGSMYIICALANVYSWYKKTKDKMGSN